MTKRSWTITAVVAAVVLAAVPLVYAGQRHMHNMGAGGFGPLGHLSKLQQELNLSDQQVGQIKAILTDLHQQNAQYVEQFHGGLQSVLSTLIKDPNNVSAAQAIIDQQAQTERTLKSNMLAAASKALNVLTPEQREKLGTIIAEHHGRFQRQF